jgi:hypothetical protein
MMPRGSIMTPEPEIVGIFGSPEMHTMFTIAPRSRPPALVNAFAAGVDAVETEGAGVAELLFCRVVEADEIGDNKEESGEVVELSAEELVLAWLCDACKLAKREVFWVEVFEEAREGA